MPRSVNRYVSLAFAFASAFALTIANVVFADTTAPALLEKKRAANAVVGYAANQSFVVVGEPREYDLYVPAKRAANVGASNQKSALVFLFHGNGGSTAQLMGRQLSKAPFKRWIEIAERDNIVLAVPQGMKAADGNRGWNDCRGDTKTNPQSDDVAFVDALLAKLLSELNIDASRVFATGISNGGHMSLRLAIERPQKFRAVGAVVASMPAKSGCASPSSPVSVLFMNGTDDPINPLNGGLVGSGKSYGTRGSVVSTEASVKFWLSHNKIVSDAAKKTFTTNESTEANKIEKFEYCCGTNQSAVVLYRVEGGGHTEPSPTERYASFFKRIVGVQSAAIEMADEVWAFFRQHAP